MLSKESGYTYKQMFLATLWLYPALCDSKKYVRYENKDGPFMGGQWNACLPLRDRELNTYWDSVYQLEQFEVRTLRRTFICTRLKIRTQQKNQWQDLNLNLRPKDEKAGLPTRLH